MTPMARLLKQGSVLRQSATDETRDVNEAYLIVHQVMTHAIGHAGNEDSNLGPALARALQNRTRRLANAESAI